MNCLSYALRFNPPNYRIYYNSDHCVNLPQGSILKGFLLIAEFGYDYFYKWYEQGLINKRDIELLKDYFSKVHNFS